MNRLIPTSLSVFILLAALATLPLSGLAVETFDSVGAPQAGNVIAGDLPQGGTADGTYFSGFTLSVTNNGSGSRCRRRTRNAW